jgi:hypothetical protein
MEEARQQGFSRFEVLMERYIRHFQTASSPVPAAGGPAVGRF